MITFWVIGSLILHLLTFYIIIHLFQRLNNVQKVDRDQIISDIEEVFTAYLTDIQEENNKLADELKALADRNRSALSAESDQEEAAAAPLLPNHRPVALKSGNAAPKKQMPAEKPAPALDETGSGSKNSENPSEEPAWLPPVDDVQDTFEESLLSRAVKLQKKGYNVTEIAKSLDRGKGEIELLLKFNEKVKH